MNNDILLMVGAQNDFERTDDDRTFTANQEISVEDNAFKRFGLRVHHGLLIHEIDYNYFRYPASLTKERTKLREIRDGCI
jgi:hypothetical protein